MPQINTYTITREDGSKLGPFSGKGLLHQYRKGNIQAHDMVESENGEKTQSLELFLANLTKAQEKQHQEQETASIRKPTKLPDKKVREVKKTTLPPKKDQSQKTVAIDQSFLDETFQANYPHQTITGPSSIGKFYGERASMLLYMALTITLIISLLHLSITISTKSELVYPEDMREIMFDFNKHSQTIGIFYFIGIGVFILCFFWWLTQAAKNATTITHSRYQRSAPALILAYILPLINFWEGYAQLRSLLNASLTPENSHYNKQRLSVGVWWFLFWAGMTYNIFRFVEFTDDGDLDTTIMFLQRTINTDLLVSCFVLLTVFFVYQINVAQRAILK